MALRDALQIGVVLSAKDLYSRTFQKAEADLRRLSKTAKDQAAGFERALTTGKRITEAGGLVLAGSVAASAGLENLAERAADLDQAGANVATVLTNVGRKQEFMGKAVEISAKSMFSAVELMGGAYELLSAGLSEDAALASMERMAQLGVGTISSVKESADLLTTVQNTFARGWDGTEMEKARRAADGMAKAVQIGKMVGPELGMSLSYAASAANTANIEFEDMLAVIVGLRNSGLRAEQAGTAYRAMLRELPDLQKKLNIQVADSEGRFRSLSDILRDLQKRYGETLEVSELAELQAALGEEGFNAIKTLWGQSDALEEYGRQLRTTGAAEELASRRMTGAQAKMAALKNEYEASSATLGQRLLPVMEKKQRILNSIVGLLGRSELAGQALGWALAAAEVGKLAGGLTTTIGLLMTYITQRRIANALEAAAAARAGAGAAGGAAAGRVLGGTALGAVGGVAGAVGAGVAGNLAFLYGGAALGQKIAGGLGILTYEQWRKNQAAKRAGGSGGSATVAMNGNINVNLTGTGYASEDARRIAQAILPHLTREMAREGRRHP